jgi:hypothetical protein
MVRASIAIDYKADGLEIAVKFPAGARVFCLFFFPSTASRYNVYQELFPWGVKQPGHETDH